MHKLTVLVVPVNAVGHTNACAGTTLPLLRRGHRVIFLLEESFRGRLAKLGFEEFHYSLPKDESEKPGEKLAKCMVQHQLLGPETAVVKIENWRRLLGSKEYQEGIIALNGGVRVAIQKFDPDLIVYDGNWLAPEIFYCGKPFIKNISVAPIFYEFEEGVPPGGSGLPSAGSQESWPAINAIRRGLVRSKSYNDLVESLGYPRFPDDQKAPPNQVLTVYAYPEELNYEQIRAKGWFNLEVFNKPKGSEVELQKLVPKDFLEDTLSGTWTGNLVYISLGSMGSMNLDLMNCLVKTLAKTKHKYIVSKGPRHSEFSLPPNMWGDRFLPQTEIISHCDLVITHGGNNTITETFATGTAMLVLPLFVDQFDNAQRLTEVGLGARVDPFGFTEEELIEAVDRLLLDQGLKDKLKVASERIQKSNRHEELAKRIEDFFC